MATNVARSSEVDCITLEGRHLLTYIQGYQSVELPSLYLPLGRSFPSFQFLHFVLDVLRAS